MNECNEIDFLLLLFNINI